MWGKCWKFCWINDFCRKTVFNDTIAFVWSIFWYRVEILVTPVQEPGRILASFLNVKLGGRIHSSTALQIAQLALKHRLNKNQKQRIMYLLQGIMHKNTYNLN